MVRCSVTAAGRGELQVGRTAQWAILVLIIATHAAAQPAPPKSGPTPASAAAPVGGSLDLGAVYIDPSFGFSLTPPAGWAVTSEKRLVGENDVELVEFAHPARAWGMSVHLASTGKPLKPEELLANIESELSAQLRNLKVIRAERTAILGRPGVRFAASSMAQSKAWLRQQAVIPVRDDELFVLIFNSPLGDQDAVTPLFDRIVESFKIIRSELTQEQLREALRRGRRLLARLETARIPEKVVPETYVRIVAKGRDVGYVRMTESPGELGRREGIYFHRTGWVFDERGGVEFVTSKMFLASDLSTERWWSRVSTLVPAGDNQPARGFFEVEDGLRERDTLVITYSEHPNAQELADRAIEVPAEYCPAALFVMLPRLIDLKKPELYAFAAYNSRRRGLVLRTYRVCAPEVTEVEGMKRSAIKIEDSEGLIPPIDEIYVDGKGKLLKLVSQDRVMIRTTKAGCEALFADRRSAAEAEMQRIVASRQGAGR